MPKRGRDELTNLLPEVSLLFIPFDAAGKFYKANAGKGVLAFEGTTNPDGSPREHPDRSRTLVSGVSGAHYLSGAEIAAALPAIVEQECDIIRNIYRPDAKYGENFDALVAAQNQDPSTWSPEKHRRVERNLRGFKHYPNLIFLSENPTGDNFPKRITLTHAAYVKKFALDHATVDGIRRVNEMAVYLREDFDKRIERSAGDSDALTFHAENVTRATDSKDEYILKVTIARKGGHSITVAGVHLRAALTSAKAFARQKERESLQAFCDKHGIQLLVGDFNMDLQESSSGSRGAFAGPGPQHQPRFLGRDDSTEAVPWYIQQYSNSSGDRHYMGYYQADTATLSLAGLGVYGMMGGSGSRSLKGGGKYYSDHPSVFVALDSTRSPPDDEGEGAARKKAKHT